MSFEKISFMSSDTPEARAAKEEFVAEFGDQEPEDADVIVALGGDGLMLQTLHRFMNAKIPVYGMNRGSVGFLMNEYAREGLLARLNNAEETIIHPLQMLVSDARGEQHSALAVNEVSLLRQTYQAAKLKLSIDGKVRMDELICDGVLVSTPAGSTAYNLSAHGPILPIRAPLLALTPISAFRPRRWRGALLPEQAHIRIDILDAAKRPVSAVADHTEFRDVRTVEVEEDNQIDISILFDQGHNLDERVIREQFLY